MDIDPAYQGALDYIYSYIDYSRTRQENLAPENFDLSRMHSLLASLRDPHKTYPSLHVAGSKGKGSTCAFIAAALRSQGYRTGLYTSPHLADFSERMQVNGQPISPQDVAALIDEMKPMIEAVAFITTFEITTALAFLYFARQQVDVAVIEVGLGGRLDATNVITPLVSVITPLYLEHTQILGDTLALIAAEKSGIIKQGVPVVLAPQEESARKVVAQVAAEKNAPLIEVQESYSYSLQERSLAGQVFTVTPQKKSDSPLSLRIPLLGRHQVTNALTAFAALQSADQAGLLINSEAIQAGFAATEWHARFEVLNHEPVVVVDAAHMPAAAHSLLQTLDDYLPDKPVFLVLGVSEDKEIHLMLEELRPRITQVLATQSLHPRAMKPDPLAQIARDVGLPAKAIPIISEALEEALQLAGDEAIVLVTGSIFAAAAGRIAWLERRPPQANT